MYFLIKLLIKYDPRSWFEILILGWGLVSNMFTCGALRDGLSFAGYNYRVWLSTIRLMGIFGFWPGHKQKTQIVSLL